MAHRIEDTDQLIKSKKEFSIRKIFRINAPNLVGKFGISFSVGRKEFFIGVAVANIEIEKVIKRKKQKALFQEGEGRVYDL